MGWLGKQGENLPQSNKVVLHRAVFRHGDKYYRWSVIPWLHEIWHSRNN